MAPEKPPASSKDGGRSDSETALSRVPSPSSPIVFEEDGISTRIAVADDGRVDIDISKSDQRLAQQIENIRLQARQQEPRPTTPPPSYDSAAQSPPPPPLNIVIQIVGSRGDVQPFVALGQVLRKDYGHRVRLATHGVFKSFVEDNGLEFFDLGGDPAELMAFMVKNPGLIPGIKSIKAGDIAKRQKGMAEIMQACWRSCADLTEIEDEQPPKRRTRAFVAHAIIANPPSFAHIHCAEKLGIPLHLMFTMPWSPTQEFPQPIANIKSTAQGPNTTNESSYSIVELLTWQGLAGVTNKFRRDILGLPELSTSAATTMIERLRVPYTYCWSPALIPKPQDWGSHIDVAGFYFLPLGSKYQPPEDLAEFLAAGPPPVYIGFGSIVVDDPDAMTTLIFDAVKKTGQRALVSKGWGGIGGEKLEKPEGVFMLGNCPHDWLFQHVSAVVHHGGAGTTAAGIALGRPTVIVPFFGDQPFWGAMVARAGAGPMPIHHKQLTADKLADAILKALEPETLERAKELGDKIHEERGIETGAACFHKQLNVDRLRCAMSPGRAAVWRVKTNDSEEGVRLSAFAATVLEHEGILDMNLMQVYRPHEWRPEEMVTFKNISKANPVVSKAGSIASGFLNYPVNAAKAWGELATEPYKGAKKSGWRGFGKGLKTGVGGVLFPRRSLIGGRSYSLRALYDSMKERMDSETLSFILATRFAEGFEDLRSSTEEERADVIRQWHQLAPDLKVSKKKKKAHPWSKTTTSLAPGNDEKVKQDESRVEEPK